ncbi:MAG TPA: ribosomal protein S18-alanine N-acetyltransferase [Gemmatimonadales bacterium]|nr:ribosomal protein S18-alanine N-acetyltransferase [Gemmatimonadales bacterium]
MADDFRIRAAEPADIAELVRIEEACFTDPWSAQGFGEVLATPGSVALLGVGADGAAVGYVLARRVLDESEILNLAVIPGYRRRGLARGLLEHSLALLRRDGIRQVFLEVRTSNQPAQQLYEHFGFRPMGLRPNYYRSPREDGLVLCLTFGPTA